MLRLGRYLLLACLAGCGGPPIHAWVAQLDDPDPQVRRAAVQHLASLTSNSKPLIDALSTASTNSDIEVREIAVAALGKKNVETGNVFPALEHALADREIAVRIKAALAVYQISPTNSQCREIFLQSLRAGHGTMFLEIGRMQPTADWAVPTLVAALSDRRPAIRSLAAKTLGDMHAANTEVESALRKALRDQMPAVREAARRSLERLSSPDTVQADG